MIFDFGDVVVSKPTTTFGGVIQYDFGKTVQSGRFARTGSLNKPPDVLLTALANLQARHMVEGHKLSEFLSEMMKRHPRMEAQFAHPGTQCDWLYEAEYDHAEENTTCSQCDAGRVVDREPRRSEDPVTRYGVIASGDLVMRHGATRDRLRRELDVLCFEMEAAGLMDSFPCLVIRGVCDYADSHKNKRWQAYAAATAAAYAKELLYIIPGNQVMGTRRADTVSTDDVSPGGLVNHREPRTSPIAIESDKTPVRVARSEAPTELLRQNGFDLEDKSINKGKALLWAAKGGHEAVVRLLLESGGRCRREG